MAADDTPSAPQGEKATINPPSAPVDSANAKSGNHKGGKHGGKGRDRGNDKKKRKHNGFGSSKGDAPSKRDQVQNNRAAKRQRVITEEADGNSYMSIPFSAEEIAAEERRPKRKVAVLIGYAGTGYHGIQINHTEKTIEGDIFAAFVAAGAISKANADDPKKSSLVRCARTDKGVHAAGNVLSLKLIVEDEDVVDKINQNLPDQIRVWGIQRTNNAFSCYQTCDSRWYEYLMPSYALLPPQPHSYIGQKIADSVRTNGVEDEWRARLGDVSTYWDEIEKRDIRPILDALDPKVREAVEKQIYDIQVEGLNKLDPDGPKPEPFAHAAEAPADGTLDASEPDVTMKDAQQSEAISEQVAQSDALPVADEGKPERELSPVEKAVRDIKLAYVVAKRRYRVTPDRIEKLQEALNMYLGTHNYHNYTVLKSFKDPSAKRHIKSFEVNPTPIQIRDTEWLSLKVHGQSFMMHQIRKMVAMAVMVVRSGSPLSVIKDSYGPRRISIPKAPGLGLMLERPMFTEYNKKAASLDREPIDFAKYDDQIKKFKDEHIYRRMFEVEENENAFHLFFNQVDNFRTDYFLWVTAGGIGASHERSDRAEKVPKALEAELGDDADGVVEDGT